MGYALFRPAPPAHTYLYCRRADAVLTPLRPLDFNWARDVMPPSALESSALDIAVIQAINNDAIDRTRPRESSRLIYLPVVLLSVASVTSLCERWKCFWVAMENREGILALHSTIPSSCSSKNHP